LAARSTLFPYTTLFRSAAHMLVRQTMLTTNKHFPEGPLFLTHNCSFSWAARVGAVGNSRPTGPSLLGSGRLLPGLALALFREGRSEEHTSELQSRENLV